MVIDTHLSYSIKVLKFLCVKGSPVIRYDFRGSAKAFRYGVNIANFVRQI